MSEYDLLKELVRLVLVPKKEQIPIRLKKEREKE